MMLKRIGLALAFGVFAANAAETIPLGGEWRFALDRSDVGVNEAWFGHELADRIKLPGILQAQGYGDEISTNTPWVLSLYDRNWYLREDYQAYTKPGNVKVPFLCQPPRHYLGAAWFQRDIEIPQNWVGKRIALFLERPRWETRVWLNNNLIGTNNSLCVPHEYSLGVSLKPGQHTVTIRVDNRMLMPYRPDAHAVSDSLGSTWNGIVGKIELRATPTVWIEDLQVFPRAETKSALVRGRLGNATERTTTNRVGLCLLDRFDSRPRVPTTNVTVVCGPEGAEFQAEVICGNEVVVWNEFQPRLFELAAFTGNLPEQDGQTVLFGFRDFRAGGSKFVLSGHETILRGTHHGGDFPLTGYPSTDVEYWRKLFITCKEWGLNHMRFHSFCPPDAAFTAADEIGFYLGIEPGMWNTFNPDSPMETMLYAETARILKAYGNHPSFVLFSPSNEPKGHWKESLPKWAEHFRAEDPRRLYTSGTGFTDPDAPGPLDCVDFITTQRFGPNRLRGESAWFGRDYSRSLQGVKIPVISHELGQWCAYPDYDIIKKFTGYLRPGNYEIFRDSLAAHGLSEKNKDFAWASGRFQLACYKEEIEANLRTPGLSGFQLLDLHDYMGQGTALVGVLDAFWESKGYATPEEFRRFCNTTVLLARLKQCVLTTADSFNVEVVAAHFGAEPIASAKLVWRVANVTGELPATRILIGKNIALGTISLDLSKLPAPRAYKLVVGLKGTNIENDWNFWLYPAQADSSKPMDVLVTSSWDEAEEKLTTGGKVLFPPRATDLDWSSPPLGHVPVFWNRLMNPAWGRMLGLWCDSKHPALAHFPTEAHCDWQWTEITRSARAVNLDGLPRQLQPIVQPIDDWNRNCKLGLIFECRVGTGKLMVCSADLESTNAVAQQLRRSLLDYMASEKFQPAVAVSATEIRGLLFETHIMRKLGATSNAANAIDGDPNTFWLAGGKHPHELEISFPSPVAMNGLVVMPRQNHREHEGDIREYTIQTSDDGQQWNEMARGELTSSFAPKKIMLRQTLTTRHLRFTAVSGFGNDDAAALAELAVIGTKSAESTGSIQYKGVKSATPEIEE